VNRLPAEQDHHRKLATALQHRAVPLIAGLQTTGTRSSRLASTKWASVNTSSGKQTDHALTFQTDHLVGAGQWRMAAFAHGLPTIFHGAEIFLPMAR